MITARIYKLNNPINDKIYIGSTTRTLNKRLQAHKTKPLNSVLSMNCDLQDIKIELVEQIECETMLEVLFKEKEHIERFKLNHNLVNKYQPILSQTEKKTYIQNYNLKYEKEKKDKQKAYRKAYYKKKWEDEEYKKKHLQKVKCDCGSIVSRCHLKRHQKTKKCLSLLTNT